MFQKLLKIQFNHWTTFDSYQRMKTKNLRRWLSFHDLSHGRSVWSLCLESSLKLEREFAGWLSYKTWRINNKYLRHQISFQFIFYPMLFPNEFKSRKKCARKKSGKSFSCVNKWDSFERLWRELTVTFEFFSFRLLSCEKVCRCFIAKSIWENFLLRCLLPLIYAGELLHRFKRFAIAVDFKSLKIKNQSIAIDVINLGRQKPLAIYAPDAWSLRQQLSLVCSQVIRWLSRKRLSASYSLFCCW